MKIVFNIPDIVDLTALVSQSMKGVFVEPGDTMTLIFQPVPAPAPEVPPADTPPAE